MGLAMAVLEKEEWVSWIGSDGCPRLEAGFGELSLGGWGYCSGGFDFLLVYLFTLLKSTVHGTLGFRV